MKFLKGQRLLVKHVRSGSWEGIAVRDFDSKYAWYPVKLASGQKISGMTMTWKEGDEMPCKRDFCKITALE